MGKKTIIKRPIRDAKDESVAAKRDRWFKWWQLIVVGVVVPLLVALIQYVPQLRDFFVSDPPQFALANPITRPDSGITILPQNRAAVRKKPLNVEFDGLLFVNAGRLKLEGSYVQWHFTLTGLSLPDSLLRDGVHRVRLGFVGDALSEPLLLIFHTQPPVVEAEVLQPPGKPGDRVFIGRVASTLQVPAETLAVDVIFHSEGQPMKISLPVRRITEEATGLTYFEFETAIQGLPQIPPTDARYAEPFFAIRVTDQAGNRYYQEESYAQFMAPGDKRFGVNSLADIEMKRWPVDLRQKTKVAFRLVPKPMSVAQLPNGERAINLKVTGAAGNMKQLEWTSIPESLRTRQPVTAILRDEQPLAISFGNQYQDEQAPAGHDPSYQVVQAGRDGRVYSSNIAKASASSRVAPSEKQNVRTVNDSLTFRDERVIGPVVAGHASEIQYCYESELRRNSDLKGKVVVRFAITPQGKVRNATIVSSNLGNAKVEQCILARIRRWSDFNVIHPQSADTIVERIFVLGY
jgi:TonB family protein